MYRKHNSGWMNHTETKLRWKYICRISKKYNLEGRLLASISLSCSHTILLNNTESCLMALWCCTVFTIAVVTVAIVVLNEMVIRYGNHDQILLFSGKIEMFMTQEIKLAHVTDSASLQF